ncbi:alkaline phosphatase family protein [Spartinivicinus ruber]|uniref:alkaline phosphatase family protein n=1 Tax=Spartinivicinus ruber TaxID=2683272 RepID=UPI0013D3F6F2|nr:alkaline phosphatase family protein [Spartinivicinus ruber]
MNNRAFDHVIIIMFENEYRSYVLQNPYMQSLARQGIELTQYYGVMHPSQTNYIASIAGELCNMSDDDPPPKLLTQKTIVDLIEESAENIDWRAYMESFNPQSNPWHPDFKPKDDYPYLEKHNPFSSFAQIVQNEQRWQKIRNETEFWKDISHGTLPEYAWFTPNMWSDGHYLLGTDESPHERAPALVDQLALWLEGFFSDLKFPGPNSLLPEKTLVVVTFDEADFEADYDQHRKYTYDGPNQIYTALLGDMIKPGQQHEGYNHYSLLKTIEKNFNLNSLGKNDQYANWFQFLWGKQFSWERKQETPVKDVKTFSITAYNGRLYCVSVKNYNVVYHIYDGKYWSDEIFITEAQVCNVQLLSMHDELCLFLETADHNLIVFNYTLSSGWNENSPLCAEKGFINNLTTLSQSIMIDNKEIAAIAFKDEQNQVQWQLYQNGQWQAPEAIGHQTELPIQLTNLGGCLYLIYPEQETTLVTATCNLAPWNVVTVAESKYAGSQDDAVQFQWSQNAFPLRHYSHEPDPVTPDEDEPVVTQIKGRAPLACAELDGVLHLVHPGVSQQQLITETFSIPGILTTKDKVSYNPEQDKTTSNGYGTQLEVGWTKPTLITGGQLAENGIIRMARCGNSLYLFFQGAKDGRVEFIEGKYNEM